MVANDVMDSLMKEEAYLTERIDKMNKWDLRFLGLSRLVSDWSKDPSTKVGAVIVRQDNSIASIGFNGFPMPMEDTEELYANRDEKYSRIVHGEINALLFCRERVHGYTLYTYPFMPCERCVVQMIQAGIERIVTCPAPAETLTRWATTFDKTRKYCQETGVELVELTI